MPQQTSGPGSSGGGNSYTEKTTRSYGSRIGDAIKGIFFGFLLIAVAFVILYWNEGRADMSKVAKTAVPTSAQSVDASLEDQLIAASGTLTATAPLAEGKYLKPGDYLQVRRTAEMYAWEEQSSSKSESKTGGSEETTTTYTYKKRWTGFPADSSNFKVPAGHENPAMAETSATLKAVGATLDAYNVILKDLRLPSADRVELSTNNIQLDGNIELANSEYLFLGYGSLGQPEIGDVRISYHAVPSGIDALVFGKADEGRVVTYRTEEGDELYRAFDTDFDSAIAQMKSEHRRSTWLLRLLGFLVMWTGFGMLFGLVSVILDFFPILGTISKTMMKFVTFVIAFVLSLLTIIVSSIMHNVYALIAVIAAALIIIFWFLKKKKK